MLSNLSIRSSSHQLAYRLDIQLYDFHLSLLHHSLVMVTLLVVTIRYVSSSLRSMRLDQRVGAST